MDILIEEEKEIKIELGDVFLDIREDYFQFAYEEDAKDFPYVLRSLSGVEDSYNAYETKRVAVENICQSIGYGNLIHYPKSEWQLVLKRK